MVEKERCPIFVLAKTKIMEHPTLNKAWQSKGISLRFANIFDNIFLTALGFFTSFTRRPSIIDAKIFVDSCLKMVNEDGWSGSLNQHCVLLREQFGINITEQSLNERFNERSEAMMRYLFEQVMKIHLCSGNPLNMLGLFEEVYIEDSTNLELPTVLKTLYKGSGGGASAAGLKIDALYALRWGTMEVRFHDSAGSDTWQGVPTMKKGSLLVRDLGYYKMADFEDVEKQGSYYLSRLKFNNNVYEDAEGKKEIDMLALLNSMKEQQTKSIMVYIGEKKRFKVRLVIQKVPKAVADHKRHKLKTDKQNKRKSLSEARLKFCDANCYITNITPEMMDEPAIIILYGLRWIIEILFKAWKSISNIKEKINSMKPHRFMCMLYAHMIKTLLDTKMVQFFKIEFWNLFGFKISELKAFGVMKIFRHQWWTALTGGKEDLIRSVLEQIAQSILALAKKRKKGASEKYNDFYTFVNFQT